MKYVIEYNVYGFRLDSKDEKPIVVAAPNMSEALSVFSMKYEGVEPHDVIKLDKVLILDCSMLF